MTPWVLKIKWEASFGKKIQKLGINGWFGLYFLAFMPIGTEIISCIDEFGTLSRSWTLGLLWDFPMETVPHIL